MKLKKWLSRALVLAMVVALMIPVPVAAKSSAGGKLVKSVTYYQPEVNNSGWKVSSKVAFKYGKKSMPTEVTYTGYTTFLGVPVSGSSSTYKYKYTGKSAKAYDTAGFLELKETLKGGKVTSWSKDTKRSEKVLNNGVVSDFATFRANVGHASYFKNGLMKAKDETVSGQDSANNAWAYTDNSVYAWTQKKGVPSMLVRTEVSNGKNQAGEQYDGSAWTTYALFNAKGFVVEEGYTFEGKNYPQTAYTYTMKKGKVDTVVVYDVDEETKVPTPRSMMKFKYTKKSVSKTFNLRVINSIMGVDGFVWYDTEAF